MSWADELLACWFPRELADPVVLGRATSRWFGAEPEFDAELRRRFAELPERALRGAPADAEREPRAALAQVLALDQLPRNLYRGSARAFAFDAAARAAALAALAAGFDARLEPAEALFLYLPLEHAEDLALQERAVQLCAALEARVPAGLAPRFSEFTSYARRHRDVIARFGRFPHRSEVLGRETTAAERAYLAAGGESFGARSGSPAAAERA